MALFSFRKNAALDAAREEAIRVQAANRTEKLLALGEALLAKLDDTFAPRLKYHIVFMAQVGVPAAQVYRDCILTLRAPLATEADIAVVKKAITDQYKLAHEPVIISWKALNE